MRFDNHFPNHTGEVGRSSLKETYNKRGWTKVRGHRTKRDKGFSGLKVNVQDGKNLRPPSFDCKQFVDCIRSE